MASKHTNTYGTGTLTHLFLQVADVNELDAILSLNYEELLGDLAASLGTINKHLEAAKVDLRFQIAKAPEDEEAGRVGIKRIYQDDESYAAVIWNDDEVRSVIGLREYEGFRPVNTTRTDNYSLAHKELTRCVLGEDPENPMTLDDADREKWASYVMNKLLFHYDAEQDGNPPENFDTRGIS